MEEETTLKMRKLRITEMGRLDVEGFKQAPKQPLCVVLDDIRSLHNVGSVFRTADAFRVERIYLCGITATPPSVEMHKTALGAEDSVDWVYCKDTLEAVGKLKEEGFEVLAVEQVEHSMRLERMPFEKGKKYAVVLGNEVKGVRQNVVEHCDGALEIPQFGTKHSLNVSVTCGMVLWELTRRRLEAGDASFSEK